MGKQSLWFYFLFHFGAYFYCKKRPEDNWVSREFHRPFMQWQEHHIKKWMLERTTKMERTYLAVVMFRGAGKSTAGTECTSSWLELLDPNLSGAISSWSEPKASDFLGVIKRLYEGDGGGLFEECYGKWATSEQAIEWAKDSFVHAARTMRQIREPSFSCTSVARGYTGGRLDFWVGDDLVPAEKAHRSPTCVEDARVHVREMLAVVKPNGLVVQYLTPHADDDVWDQISLVDGIRSWEGIEPGKAGTDYKLDPENGRWHLYYMPARDEVGLPVLPNQCSDEFLRDLEDKDPLLYLTQYALKRVASKYRRLTPEWMKNCWIRREEVPQRARHVINLDTAWKDEKDIDEGCESAIVHGCIAGDGSGDVFFFEALHSLVWNSDDFYNELISMLARLQMDPRSQDVWVTDDAEVGGKTGNFKEVLVTRCRAAGIRMPQLIQIPRRSPNYKQVHIKKFLDYIHQGKVRFVQGGAGLNVMVEQALRFGSKAMLNDVIDAAKDIFHQDVYLAYNPQSYGVEDANLTRRAGDKLLRAEEYWEAREQAEHLAGREPFWRDWKSNG